VIRAQKDPMDAQKTRAMVARAGMNETGSPGYSTGDVKTSADVKVPVFAIGVNDRFTLAVAIPIVRVQVRADSGFNKSADGQRFIDTICRENPAECESAVSKINDPVNQKLRNLGYAPIQSETFTGIGDVQVVGKYLLSEKPLNRLAVKTTVLLPTGQEADPDRALDVPLGEGRWGLGAGAVFDQKLPFNKDTRWNLNGGATMLLPGKVERRLPYSETDPLSEDKTTVLRKTGAILGAGTALAHEFPRAGLTLGAGYNLAYMTGTSYERGSEYAAYRYDLLDRLRPSQTLHSVVLSAGFSSVDWYKAKKFFYPFQANLSLSHPIAGRNVATADVLAGELVLFF
jgi:hypothetical protein